MKCGKTFEEFEALNGISVEEILSVFEAVSQAYPMIVSANLTKNTYTSKLSECVFGEFFQRETITTVWTGKARGICQALSKGAW